MATPRLFLKETYSEDLIEKELTNEEIFRNAKDRLVHPKDMDHETIPTTNHVQLILDNLKKSKGKRSNLAVELLNQGYKKDVVRKIMDTINMYEFK